MTVIAESRPLKESISSVGNKRMRVRIIEGNRWGSSGYYSQEVLERDGPTAFPAGTQMYLDHPSESEERDRPERSVKDLAGKTVTEATWDTDGLYADVEVYGFVAPVIAEMADDIGLSVRASALLEQGEVEGRAGLIVARLIDGYSVDYVTKAGAGGRIVEIMESARENVEEAVSDADWSDFSASDYTPEQWRRACLIDTGEGEEDSKGRYKLPVREPDGDYNRNGIHAAAAALAGARGGVQASDEQKQSAARKLVSLYRNQLDEDPPESLTNLANESVEEATYMELINLLSNAVRAEYSDRSGDNFVYAYVRDFDDSTVWFEVWDRNQGEEKVYQQNYQQNSSGGITLTGERVEVVAQVKYVVVSQEAETTRPEPSRVYESVPGKTPADRPTPTKESSMGDTTISESRLRELEESAKQVDTLKEQLTEAQTKEKDALVTAAKETLRANKAEAKLIVSNEMHKAGITGEALSEALSTNPPLTEDEKVDEKALRESVQKSLGEVSSVIDESRGGVRGFGEGEGTSVSEADANKAIAGAFGREVKA